MKDVRTMTCDVNESLIEQKPKKWLHINVCSALLNYDLIVEYV